MTGNTESVNGVPEISPARFFLPVAAGTAAGAATWCTRAVLALTGSGGRTVRVAMLPSLLQGAALIAGCVIACLAILWLIRRLCLRRKLPARLAVDALLPLFGTLILVLPYLPYVADAWPALTVLSGPIKYIVWIVALTLVARGCLLATRLPDALPAPKIRTTTASLLVFMASVLAFASVASRLVGTPLFPRGDEPHYLVIAQSLWRDGDLRIENNHQRGDTLEYYPEHLAPDYLTRGVDRQIYSVHPIGLPVIAAPVYALGGYHAVVALMIALAAASALLMWRLAFRATGSAGAATFAWMASALSAPFVFNSFAVYPEIPAGLLVMLSYGLATGRESRALAGSRRWFACGCALAALPWLSTKYVVMAGALGVIAWARLWCPPRSDSGPLLRRPMLALFALCVPVALSLGAWFAFFWLIWGRLSPSAPYGRVSGTALAYLAGGGPGLFFDQEYGLLPVAPVLWLSVVGLIAMLGDSAARRTAVEIGAAVLGLLVMVGSFHLWWGGSAAVGRPMIAGLPLLSVPVAWRFHQQRHFPAVRAAHFALLIVGLAIVWIVATVNAGFILATTANGRAPLLEWASPSWNLAALAPTFIVDPPTIALRVVAVWLAVACIAGLALRHISAPPGRAGLAAMVAASVAIGAASLGVPRLLGHWMPQPRRLETRSEVGLLSDFSPSRRPLAIRYEPFERLTPRDVPSLFQFVARPDDDRPIPPVSLLHHARWSLPAGRYHVELHVPAGGQTPEKSGLALQLGRLGSPIEEWVVTFDRTGRWSVTFDLPLSVGTVGFQATPDLASLQPALALRPIAIDDVRERPDPAPVLRTIRYGATWVFFHDDRTEPQSRGFWTPGGRPSVMTLVSPSMPPPRLRLRAGPIETTVRVWLNGSSERIDLAPRETRELAVPSDLVGAFRVSIESSRSFVASELDPRSRDARRLGCWVELVPAGN